MSRKVDGSGLSGAMKSGSTLNDSAKAAGTSSRTVQRHVKETTGTNFSTVRNVTRNASLDKGGSSGRK